MEKYPQNNEKRRGVIIRELARRAVRAFTTQPLASHGDHFQKPREVQGELDLRSEDD